MMDLPDLCSHLQALVDQRVRLEFPELGHVDAVPVGNLFGLRSVAWWDTQRLSGGPAILFNLFGDGKLREFQAAPDGSLIDLIRHELLHGDRQRRGLPFGEHDAGFLAEAFYRGIPAGDGWFDGAVLVMNHDGRGHCEVVSYKYERVSDRRGGTS